MAGYYRRRPETRASREGAWSILIRFREETMRVAVPTLLLAALLAAHPAYAQELKVASTATVESLITAQKGKRVTVRTRSGQELTGVVREVTPRFVQLGALSGREFFDAVVSLDAVEAVIVRTKE
jgi:hypothetical protein